MAEVIEMPKLSDTMEEGVLASWNVEVGQQVSSDDVLAEVETDKATMEVPAYFDGVVLHLEGQPGDGIPIGGLLAIIGKKGEDVSALIAQHKNGGNGKKAAVPSPAAESTPQAAAAGQSPEKPVTTGTSDRILASPLAKRLAEEHGLSLEGLSGSGDGGRIVKRDIEAALEGGTQAAPTQTSGTASAPAAPPQPAPQAAAEDTDQKVSQMRKTIAKRLSESKFTAPHFYLTLPIDMSGAMAFRNQLKAEDVKVSFNDLVVKASAMALRQHPAVNSSWYGDVIRQHANINIGVAVAVPDGLVVPVVRNADHKGLQAISAEVKDMATRARDKHLKPEEMQGNTFSISNLGMFGIEEFTAIINPPDACILAVGAIREEPVVKNGALAVGHTMRVTMSCDHRVVDGATGSEFLKTLRYLLENPMRMLL